MIINYKKLPHVVKPAVEQMYHDKEGQERALLIENVKLKEKELTRLKKKVRGKLIKKGLQRAIDEVLAADSLDELYLEQQMTVHFMNETFESDDQNTVVPKTRVGANAEKTVEMLQRLTRSVETDINKLQEMVLRQDMSERQNQRFERQSTIPNGHCKIIGSRYANLTEHGVEIETHLTVINDLIDKVYRGEL